MRNLLVLLVCFLGSLTLSAQSSTTRANAPVAVQGDAFSISHLSDSVFARMQGRSYPHGCTVSRDDLRYVTILHVDIEGRQHRGELVCHKAIAQDLADIFRQLFQARYPIASVRLIDDFDADDERSMTANNTSCFCYRPVSGTQRLSRHALGMAIDINPLYNPYVRGQRVQPKQGRPYADRSRRFDYKIERGDLLWRLFTEHGFRWGGSWRTLKDWQHFEK